MQDADGDEVRCRMADSTMGECGSICNAFPNSELDQVNMKDGNSSISTNLYPYRILASYHTMVQQREDLVSQYKLKISSLHPVRHHSAVYLFNS